ncbi:fatty acid desaturase [Arenibaculum sp.]|uniref:fatty acid desaturase n=1 Tax=Arenibaculum sp. TaxID=2865862 RepID=UPI002E0DA3E4|nr:fatty acid desaturase [Arenibaculum sp.]
MPDQEPKTENAHTRREDGRIWGERLAPYKHPDRLRSLRQIGTTLACLAALVALMGISLENAYWLSLILAVPTAFFLVRAFIVQHDCGHGSFFRSRRANDWLGRCLGVLTLTPYAYWQRDHAVHHATSGDLDRRGVGDIDTLTVREYLARSRWGRLQYRLYRHPAVLFGIGPVFLFFVKHRLALGHWRRDRRAWISVMTTNAAIAVAFAAAALVFGAGAVAMVWVPVMVLASTIGIWLFYVQHQFDDVYWRRRVEWDFHEAAMEGCSLYDLPPWLHWLTGWIGYHHVHHLSSKIPNYRLRDCHAAIRDLQRARRLGLSESLRTVGLALWDEDNGRMIGFGDLRARMAPAA